MKCKVYSWLFRIFPLKGWQAFLLKFHFNQCPDCGEKIETNKNIKPIFFSALDFQHQSDLWPEIKKEIEQAPAEPKKRIFPSKHFPVLQWQWITAALVLIGMAILIPNLILKKGEESLKGTVAENIIVKSIKFNNQPAKTYFFQTRNPKRLIIWVQKTK